MRSANSSPHPAYRADIDGLRALAVVPVVFYHAGIRGFSGGFAGVDVFFVISGYLITGILMRDLANDRYSITEFYRRRILRIFPALAVMLVVVAIAGAILLLPPEIPDLAASVAATAAFGSNILFYRSTDYFGPLAASQPLLHTWSLAVEEQWYIVWPVMLALIGAHRGRLMLAAAVALTVGSFVFGLWLLPRDAAGAYYLVPARAWELGLGAILAMWSVRPPRGLWNEILALSGFAMILFAFKFYTHDTAFPGLAAVPPALGAALLLFAGQRSTLVGRLLSLTPVRFVGLISYSLYLWHWPVIVLSESGLLLPKSALVSTGMVAVSAVLAILSWYFVERPFRTGQRGWSTRSVLLGGVGAIVGLLALAAILPGLVSSTTRLTPEQATLAGYLTFDGDAAYRRGLCFKVGPRGHYDAMRCLASTGEKPALLLVGDSHAAQLWPGLARHADEFDILQATATGCVARLQPSEGGPPCAKVINRALRERVRSDVPDILILASRWQEADLEGLEATLRDPGVQAANPILVGPVPEYAAALPRLLIASERRGEPSLAAQALVAQRFDLDRKLRKLAVRTGTTYFSPIRLLCTGRGCQTRLSPTVPMQFDSSHLTVRGSALVVDAMLPVLRATAHAAPSRP